MNVPSSLVPQLVVNVVMLAALLAYLPRALERKKLRFAVIVLSFVMVAAIWANLQGYALQGIVQGFKAEKV